MPIALITNQSQKYFALDLNSPWTETGAGKLDFFDKHFLKKTAKHKNCPPRVFYVSRIAKIELFWQNTVCQSFIATFIHKIHFETISKLKNYFVYIFLKCLSFRTQCCSVTVISRYCQRQGTSPAPHSSKNVS